MFDTDHGFYLLAGEIVHDGTAHVPQLRILAEQRVHGHLGGHADVGDLLAGVVPLADVHQPLGGGQVFKHVAHLKDNKTIYIIQRYNIHNKLRAEGIENKTSYLWLFHRI